MENLRVLTLLAISSKTSMNCFQFHRMNSTPTRQLPRQIRTLDIKFIVHLHLPLIPESQKFRDYFLLNQNKFPMRILLLLLPFIALFQSACKQQDPPLFRLVESDESGIQFANR